MKGLPTGRHIDHANCHTAAEAHFRHDVSLGAEIGSANVDQNVSLPLFHLGSWPSSDCHCGAPNLDSAALAPPPHMRKREHHAAADAVIDCRDRPIFGQLYLC
jgi:hypothetical protein